MNVYKRHTCHKHFANKSDEELKLKLDQFLEPNIPTLLAGDFNARHPLWGGIHNSHSNSTGEQIATFLENNGEEYTILNDDTPTFHRSSENVLLSTAIDLTIVSHHLIHKSGWQLTSLIANHVGILTTLGEMKHTPTGIPCSRVWNTKEANWPLFQQNLDEVLAKDSNDTDLTESENLESEANHII